MTIRGLGLSLLLVLASCRRPKPALPDDAPPAPPDASETRTVRIPDETRELIVALVPSWDATTATLTHWRRDGGAWIPLAAPWPAVIGHGGAAWGSGLHGAGAPDRRRGPVKREGDGRSPAGMFAIGPTFGYAPAPPPGARVAYTAVTPTWRCVDDPASTHYNRVLDEATVARDWSSAEDMRRDDALYQWVVEVRHNPAAAPGGGSCIFLHAWSGPGTTTTGCTAMATPDLERMIAVLDPGARPVLVLLPADEAAALAEAWGLPQPLGPIGAPASH